MVRADESLRLIEIAARAGVTHSNVLRHFGSAGELERQLAQRVAVRLAERRRRIVPSIELVILVAVGYGLVGRRFDTLFENRTRALSVARTLSELIAPRS